MCHFRHKCELALSIFSYDILIPEIEEKVIAVPAEVLNSLRSRACGAGKIVAQLREILQLDLRSREEPKLATKRLIRDLATKAKQEGRHDVLELLREIVPAGTTGESFFFL